MGRSKTGEPKSSKAQLLGAELDAKKTQVDGDDRGEMALLRELNEIRGQSLQPDVEERKQRPEGTKEPDRTAASFKAKIAA